MVRIPPINNDATSRRKVSSVIQQIGITLFLDLLDTKKEAYFLDVENGTNPAGAFAFRLANGANDTLNFFLGQPLAETPTVQDVINNPSAHFQRLMVGTNLDVRRAIAENPAMEGQINSGLQERRSRGDSLVQVIANAINADKDTRRAFDSYIIRARELAIEAVETAAETAVGGLDDNIGRLVNGLADFVIDAAFARPRRSGDSKRVSKEQHEYNYLSQEKIKAYGFDQFGEIREQGWTHLEIAMQLLRLNFSRVFQGQPGLRTGADLVNDDNGQFELDDEGITEEEPFFRIPDEMFDASRFSYGNFIDSYHMRKLLAELKKLVQSTRVDNVTDFLRRQGTTREEFLNNTLHRLAPNGFISLAANEFFINTFFNPTRPVRDYVDSTEVVQAYLREDGIQEVPAGPLLTFAAAISAPPQTQNLTNVNDQTGQ